MGFDETDVAYHLHQIDGMRCQYASQPTLVRSDMGSIMDAIEDNSCPILGASSSFLRGLMPCQHQGGRCR